MGFLSSGGGVAACSSAVSIATESGVSGYPPALHPRWEQALVWASVSKLLRWGESQSQAKSPASLRALAHAGLALVLGRGGQTPAPCKLESP